MHIKRKASVKIREKKTKSYLDFDGFLRIFTVAFARLFNSK